MRRRHAHLNDPVGIGIDEEVSDELEAAFGDSSMHLDASVAVAAEPSVWRWTSRSIRSRGCSA